MNFAAMAVFLRRELVCRHLRSSMSAMMSSALPVVSLRVNLVIALVVLFVGLILEAGVMAVISCIAINSPGPILGWMRIVLKITGIVTLGVQIV